MLELCKLNHVVASQDQNSILHVFRVVVGGQNPIAISLGAILIPDHDVVASTDYISIADDSIIYERFLQFVEDGDNVAKLVVEGEFLHIWDHLHAEVTIRYGIVGLNIDGGKSEGFLGLIIGCI